MCVVLSNLISLFLCLCLCSFFPLSPGLRYLVILCKDLKDPSYDEYNDLLKRVEQAQLNREGGQQDREAPDAPDQTNLYVGDVKSAFSRLLSFADVSLRH